MLSRSASYLLTNRCLVCLHALLIYIYRYTNTSRQFDKIQNKISTPRSETRHDASTAVADPVRFGRYEESEAHRANTKPTGAPHLELGRLRHKTWSKPDYSIADATWPTYLYIYIFCSPTIYRRGSSQAYFLEHPLIPE